MYDKKIKHVLEIKNHTKHKGRTYYNNINNRISISSRSPSSATQPLIMTIFVISTQQPTYIVVYSDQTRSETNYQSSLTPTFLTLVMRLYVRGFEKRASVRDCKPAGLSVENGLRSELG